VKITVKILRFISRHTWWWTVALIILLAILLTAARLLLPALGSYKDELEMQVSQVIGQPVQVHDFEVGWHGYGPRIYLHKVRLLDRGGQKTLFGFDDAYIDVSLPLSIYRHQVALQNLTLSGIELSLVRQPDGAITLGGVALPGAAAPDTGDAVFRWLFSQTRLSIEKSVVHWHDLRQGDFDVTMHDVNLSLGNSGDDHVLTGRVTLPSTLGGGVQVMAKAHGSVNDFRGWTADLYAKGTGLELVQWLVDQPGLGMRMVNGQAEIELWAGWRKDRLDNIKGYLSARKAYLVPDKPVPDQQDVKIVSSLFGEFVWQKNNDGWTLDVDRFKLVMDGLPWEPARVHVAETRAINGDHLEVATNFARVDDLATLLSLSSRLSQEQREMLLTTKPRGELHNAFISLDLNDGELENYFVRGELKELALLPWKKLPGFDGLDLSVNMNKSGGVADVGTRGAYLDLHQLFRDFFPMDEMLGRLAWQRQPNGYKIDLRQLQLANADAAVQLDGNLFLPDDDSSPLVKLLVDIKRGNGEAASRYMPVKVMPEKTVAWLDHAIVSGKVTSGAMLLQGPIKNFPFTDGSGRFEVRFNVSNGILDYHEGWPRIEQIETQVGFVGNSMSIQAVAGKVLGADIKQVDVEIPQLRAHPAVLHLVGRAEGSAGDVVDFLNKSPLQERFGGFTAGAEADGPVQLDLSLTIPFEPGAHVETHGLVSLDHARIDFKHQKVDLSDIVGNVEFSGKGLSAKSVTAKVMGQPANIDIFSEDLARGKVNLVLQAKGKTSYPELAKRLDLFVFPHLEGSSRWQARLEIPHSKEGGVVQPTLKLTSNLRGTRVNLPAPLSKGTKSKRELELYGRFEKDARHWFFDYGNETLTGAFKLEGEQGKTFGEIHFNGSAKLPEKPGIRIGGHLANFDYDQWYPLLANQAQTRQGEKARPPLVNQLDLDIKTAQLFGQTLSTVNVTGEHDKSEWAANVKSDRLTGKVWLPDDLNNGIRMDLEKLYLARAENKDEKSRPIDPTVIPPLDIKSKQSRYGDLGLGKLELVTKRRAGGLRLERLKVDSDILRGTIQGDWTKAGAQHVSRVKADLRILDLGSLLGGLGYVKAVKNGEGVGQFNLTWQGPLLDYDLASLNGTVDFDFNDGSLLEVDPGAGRFFGLLSVSALPRRLKLDFSDFFGKGYAFDYMRGHFDIRDGNAFTKKFNMDGPSASIELTGRVGLAKEDYDQRVKVVPHVTSGLPTLAGILTGSFAPAVIVALIEKLAKPEVDKATGIYYQVTGSWDDPKIVPVDVVKSDEEKKSATGSSKTP
jgi:uncharacterized protein (TIGR02099 family)